MTQLTPWFLSVSLKQQATNNNRRWPISGKIFPGCRSCLRIDLMADWSAIWPGRIDFPLRPLSPLGWQILSWNKHGGGPAITPPMRRADTRLRRSPLRRLLSSGFWQTWWWLSATLMINGREIFGRELRLSHAHKNRSAPVSGLEFDPQP